MTLSDFRTAVADMGWRIGFDQIADKDREIAELKRRVAELEKQIKSARNQGRRDHAEAMESDY